MELSTSRFAVPIIVAAFATLLILWPEKYVGWIRAMKQKMPPAMRAGADAMSPLSSSKPWYPKYLRVMGILIWAGLLSLAYLGYLAYRF